MCDHYSTHCASRLAAKKVRNLRYWPKSFRRWRCLEAWRRALAAATAERRDPQIEDAERLEGQVAAVNLSRHSFHGDWNYTISPTASRVAASELS